MAIIREEVVNAALNKAYNSIDTRDDIPKQCETQQEIILADGSLTKDEKTEATKELNNNIYDRYRIIYNKGPKRFCEGCNEECLATSYCENCVRNYLKANFSNWASGNDDIDNMLKKFQEETIHPSMVAEWIPYNNLKNVKYLTEGGFSEIFTAEWDDGRYEKWDPKEKQLKRFGTQKVILKRLKNVESANQSWFEEAKSHLTIGNKWKGIVQCYGLTRDSTSYMLVMDKMDTDLYKYLQQNNYQLTWKERIKIIYDITAALKRIIREGAIHRDLHSGNILYSNLTQKFDISDLGLCGPADKSSKKIYGKLPYVAPEVIYGKEHTYASDIYSFGMLMWEISSGKPPFSNYEHDYNLALSIVNGIRPKIVSGTPLEYKNLMKQCWDAEALKRPDSETLFNEIHEISKYYLTYESILPEANNLEMNYMSSRPFTSTSKVHQFEIENMPEPRNATEEQQEAFHSKQYDEFVIPDNIEDLENNFGESSHQNNDDNTVHENH